EFSYELQLHDDDEDEVRNLRLPPMILQPFVENAIWHGLMPKQGEKKLRVSIEKREDLLHCVVEDNGVGRQKTTVDRTEHVSRGEKMISDMMETLQQLLHVEAQIVITDLNVQHNGATGTRVEIQIPGSPAQYKN